MDIVNAKDGSKRLFIVEQTGTIKIWTGTSLIPSPFLDVTDRIVAGGERGLLSLVFHPDYSNNRYFFVYFNDKSGSITIRRYQTKITDANQADTATGVTLFTIPKRFGNHNGGKLLFGPDGYLYFGTGDGGSRDDPDNNAQNGTSLLGKMIRVDVNNSSAASPYYAIPPNNPYINNSAFRPEIVAVGLRNPWRYSFDRQTGNTWLADVGQDNWEEVNVLATTKLLGANYGWSCFEGMHAYKTNCNAQPDINNSVVPIFEYPHNNTTGGLSITGGLVYRGLEFPILQGYYLCTDFVTGNGWLIKQNSAGTGYDVTMQSWETSISSFGELEDSVLYATGLNGILYKVKAEVALPLHIASFNGAVENNFHTLKWSVTAEKQEDIYIIEKRTSANEPFTEVHRVVSGTNRQSSSYNIRLNSLSSAFYRIKKVSNTGEVNYTAIIYLNNSNSFPFQAYVSGKSLFTSVPANAVSISLFSAEGKLLVKQSLTGRTNVAPIALENIPRGLIVVKVQLKDGIMIKKILY